MAEVITLWSSWAGVSLWFSFHSASHTHCLLYNFIGQGNSNSDPTENVYDQGDLDTVYQLHVWRCSCVAAEDGFEYPLCLLLLSSTILIFQKKKISSQYFLPTKSLAPVPIPKWGLTFKWVMLSLPQTTLNHFFHNCSQCQQDEKDKFVTV